MPLGDVAVSRREIREAIAAGLAASLPSAQAVYGYLVQNLQQQSPAVRVFSVGTLRPQLTAQGIRSTFYVMVQLWVAIRDGVEEQAENQLDALEHELTGWLVAHQSGAALAEPAPWTALQYDRPSIVDNVTVAGMAYVVEDIVLRAEVYG